MVKRFFDILISILAIIILAIPSLIITLMIKLSSKGPVLYWSRRIGQNNQFFMMPKFRTMKINTPEVATDKLSIPDNYLTPSGRFLRRTSLDEIPQFFNVLKGDMSLVGPRPFPEGTLNKLSKKKRVIRCSVRPGLTGYSQVNYKGKKRSLNQKVAQDIVYINNRDIWLYFRILFFTPMTLLRRFFLNKSGKSLWIFIDHSYPKYKNYDHSKNISLNNNA